MGRPGVGRVRGGEETPYGPPEHALADAGEAQGAVGGEGGGGGQHQHHLGVGGGPGCSPHTPGRDINILGFLLQEKMFQHLRYCLRVGGLPETVEQFHQVQGPTALLQHHRPAQSRDHSTGPPQSPSHLPGSLPGHRPPVLGLGGWPLPDGPSQFL